MAVQTAPARFCGRCGAPLAPGAPYCGRCGTPVMQAAVAAPPMYRYPPPAYPAARPSRLAPAMVAGGLVLIVAIAAIAVAGLAAARSSARSHAACTANCSPKFVTPLPEEASFRSSAYKFQVNYPSDWAVRSQDASGVMLGTKVGAVQITGSRGQIPDQAVRSLVSGLPTARWQDVTLVATLKGAHLGDQDGVGYVYSANVLGTSQTATKVRFAVIAASRDGVTVLVFAVDPADPKNSPNGMPEGQAFDYLCTEFVWG